MRSRLTSVFAISACVALAALLVVIILHRLRSNSGKRSDGNQSHDVSHTEPGPKWDTSKDVTASSPDEASYQVTSSVTRRERRLEELEKAGKVPTNASPEDWQLAQKTTWWGKPVDPARFWTNKTRWLGPQAMHDAKMTWDDIDNDNHNGGDTD